MAKNLDLSLKESKTLVLEESLKGMRYKKNIKRAINKDMKELIKNGILSSKDPKASLDNFFLQKTKLALAQNLHKNISKLKVIKIWKLNSDINIKTFLIKDFKRKRKNLIFLIKKKLKEINEKIKKNFIKIKGKKNENFFDSTIFASDNLFDDKELNWELEANNFSIEDGNEQENENAEEFDGEKLKIAAEFRIFCFKRKIVKSLKFYFFYCKKNQEIAERHYQEKVWNKIVQCFDHLKMVPFLELRNLI